MLKTAFKWIAITIAAIAAGVLLNVSIIGAQQTQPGILPYVQTYQQATSTFTWGINLSGGCFSIAGICLGNDGTFSTTSANSWLSTKTTSNIAEGVNEYFTQTKARNAISETITGIDYLTGVFSLASGYNIPLTASTTNWESFYLTPSSRITAGSGLSWAGNTLNATGASGFSTTSADYWDTTKNRWATTSSDYWLTTKSTTNLSEGSNLYWTSTRATSAVSALIAATTTTALAEGSRLYYTDTRVGNYISGSSTVPHIGGSAWGDLLYWTGTGWLTRATSTLGIVWGDLRGVPAGFADGIDDTGGGGSNWTINGTEVYPNAGRSVSAPYITATSTTATSTFAGPVKLTANSGYGGNNDSEGLLNLSMGTYTGSALNIQATGAASASQGEIVHIEQTNASHANEILKIESNSTQGGAEDIYIMSPVPDVVLCDTTDSSNDCGELEVSSHGEWLFNFRNAADTSFERGVIFTPTRIGGMVGIGTEFDTPFLGAKLTVVGSTTLDLLDLNSAGNTTAGGNLFTVKSDGKVGIGTTSPYAKLSVVGETVSQKFTATDTAATSTLPTLSVQAALNLFGTFANSLDDLCTAITGGSGLCDGTDNTGGAPAWGTITGTLSAQTDLWSVLDPKLSSTTLALFDKGFFFSTTSAFYHLNSLDKGYFFSTSSANAWDATKDRFSTTSSAYWLGTYDKGWFFSTTSVNYWETTKPRWATSSSDYWLTQKTTDNLTQGATNKYWAQSLFDTAFSGKSTTNLTEGTNLYWTQARFDTAFSGKTTDNLSQGSTNKYWSNTLFDNRLAATGTLPNLYTLSGLASVGSTTGTTTVVGGFRLSSLNCSGLANGGALTVNASGEVVCTADDGGAGANYWATASGEVFPNAASSVSAPVFRATSTTATSTFSGPATFTQAAGKNLLSIIPSGNIGTVSANIGEGALIVDNTLNTYTPGLYVSSDQASVPSNPLVLIRSTSASYNQGLLWLLGANTNTGGNAFGLRIQDGNPDIEFREADQTAPAGMYELDINNDLFRINGRNSANNSYDTLAWFSRQDAGGPEMGGRFCLGCGFSDYAGFRFNIVATSVPAAPYLTLSTASTTGAIGNVLTVTKDGLLGLSTSTPSAMLSLTGKAGGKLAQWLTSAGTNMLDIANDTATAVLRGTWDFSNATVKAHVYKSFTYATSTSWQGTTTLPLGTAFVAETWNKVDCYTDTGTVNLIFSDGTNKMNSRNASSTASRYDLSSNNTFVVEEKRQVEIGTPASSPTKLSCTVDITQN